MVSTRRLIRASIAELLKGNTPCGDRVSTNRSDRIWEKEVPAAVIYTSADPASIRDLAPLLLNRDLEVNVDVWSKIDSSTGLPLDDELDDLVETVERLIIPKLGPLAKVYGGDLGRWGYLGFDTFTTSSEGRVPLAGARLRFQTGYLQEESEVDPAQIAALLRIHVDIDLPTPDPEGTIESELDIELPQT